MPAFALVLVYDDSITPVCLRTSVPLRYQDTFTVWFTFILNVLIEPSVSSTGERGELSVMTGGTGGNDVTFTCYTSIDVDLSTFDKPCNTQSTVRNDAKWGCSRPELDELRAR